MLPLQFEGDSVMEVVHWLQFMEHETEGRVIKIIAEIQTEEDRDTLLQEEVVVLSGKGRKIA